MRFVLPLVVLLLFAACDPAGLRLRLDDSAEFRHPDRPPLRIRSTNFESFLVGDRSAGVTLELEAMAAGVTIDEPSLSNPRRKPPSTCAPLLPIRIESPARLNMRWSWEVPATEAVGGTCTVTIRGRTAKGTFEVPLHYSTVK